MADSNQPGGKHVPGAIAILLATGNYDPLDNGKRVKLIRSIPIGGVIDLHWQQKPVGTLFHTGGAGQPVWEVEAVDGHLHLTATLPVCVTNNAYKQSNLLIIGDESLVKDEHTMEQQHAADKTWKIVDDELAKL